MRMIAREVAIIGVRREKTMMDYVVLSAVLDSDSLGYL
jgi:hypothetical protein